MDESRLSRRSALEGATGVAVVGSLTGCLDRLPFFGGEEEATVDVGPVPANADMLIRGDAETLLGDEAWRSALDAGIETVMVGETPGSVEGMMQWLEAVYGLDPRVITEGVGFTDVSPAEPIESTLGALVRASWEPESIPRLLEGEGFVTSERTVGNVTVHNVEQEISQVAILEPGWYLIGTEDAVESVVAIQREEAESLSGGPLSAYRAVGDGVVRFGARVEPLIGGITTLFPVASEQIADLLSNVETTGAKVTIDGERRGVRVRFSVTNESRAEQFENVVEAAFVVAGTEAEEGGPLAAALEKLTLERDGSVVTLDYEASAENLGGQIEALVSFFVGEGVVDLPDPDEIEIPNA